MLWIVGCQWTLSWGYCLPGAHNTHILRNAFNFSAISQILLNKLFWSYWFINLKIPKKWIKFKFNKIFIVLTFDKKETFLKCRECKHKILFFNALKDKSWIMILIIISFLLFLSCFSKWLAGQQWTRTTGLSSDHSSTYSNNLNRGKMMLHL